MSVHNRVLILLVTLLMLGLLWTQSLKRASSDVGTRSTLQMQDGSFEDLGPALLSLGIVGAEILEENNSSILYATTRNEQPAHLLRVNLATERLEGIWELESSNGAWATALSAASLYIGSCNNANVYVYSLRERRITSNTLGAIL